MPSRDYYRILQVDPAAEQEVIEAAYRRLARKYHPDSNQSLDATRRMQEINEAYEVLRDPARRAEYDAERAAEFGEFEPTQPYAEETTPDAEWDAQAAPAAAQPPLQREPTGERAATGAPRRKRSPFLIFGLAVLVGGAALLAIAFIALGAVAFTPLGDTLGAMLKPSTSRPSVVISSPQSGTRFLQGEEVVVRSTTSDPTGIARVELSVDGKTVRTDLPPIQGQTSFTLIQRWRATLGSHTLGVRAYNSAGIASDPAMISILVEPQPPAEVIASPTLLLPTRTLARPTPRIVPATPTITAPPGVYATSIRVEPMAPKRGEFVTFFVTFFNNTSSARAYQWRIRIFEPDKRHSLGDTTPIKSDIRPGTSELASADNWRVIGPGGCLQLFARAFWIDPDTKQETEFVKPDQSGGPAAGFEVCP